MGTFPNFVSHHASDETELRTPSTIGIFGLSFFRFSFISKIAFASMFVAQKILPRKGCILHQYFFPIYVSKL